jgi:hypothetical protein
MYSKLDTGSLVLLITSRCNLKCDYCQVLKEDKDMNFETAWRAVSLFFGEKNNSRHYQIKFFGGEPLLNYGLIEDIVKLANKKYKNISFKLTTNGTFLNKDVLKFINDNSNIDLVISSGNIDLLKKGLLRKIVEVPRVTVNMNFFPGGLGKSEDQFRKFCDMGFSSFNFLPAYFTAWSKKEVTALRSVFEKIAEIVRSSSQKIYITNLEICSAVPLFNLAPVVSQEGDIFAGNFISDKRFAHFRSELKLGNVHNIRSWKGFYDLSFDFDFLAKKVFSDDILASTDAVDRELSRFVDNIKKIQKKQ